jgi:uncharacterized protein YbjT (DUF2867 family)
MTPVRILLLGATGVVGREALRLALEDSRVAQVTAPTRRPLAPHPKLTNPVAERLESVADGITAGSFDALLCALGTTIAKAGSKSEFRRVDYALPIAFAKRSHAAGTRICAVVTAVGASPSSVFFYAKTKGEVERDLESIGFDSLSLLRPVIIQGHRNETRSAERAVLAIAHVLGPLLPKGLRPNPAARIAQVLLDSVFAAKPGVTRVLSKDLI